MKNNIRLIVEPGKGIGPVFLGMSETQVIEALGPPDRATTRKRSEFLEQNITPDQKLLDSIIGTYSLYFNNIKVRVEFRKGFVEAIEVSVCSRTNVFFENVSLHNRLYTEVLNDLKMVGHNNLTVAEEGLVDLTRSTYFWCEFMVSPEELLEGREDEGNLQEEGVISTVCVASPGYFHST